MRFLATTISPSPSARWAPIAAAALVALLALLAVVIDPVLAQGPGGNNGTVKIHDGPSTQEPSPAGRDQPHVGCVFHIHAFNLDPGQSGDWWIREVPPTGNGELAASGDYEADGNGEFEEEVDLTAFVAANPSGHNQGNHFKLWVEGELKHKVFWVACEQELGPATPPPTQEIGDGEGTPPGSPEQVVERSTGTPGTVPDTATTAVGAESPLVAGLLGLLLLASLTTIAWARLTGMRPRA